MVYLFIQRVLSFLSTQSEFTVQQTIRLFATHINDKAKIKMQCRKGFLNVNISNIIKFVSTHCRNYKTTSFEKEQSIASLYINMYSLLCRVAVRSSHNPLCVAMHDQGSWHMLKFYPSTPILNSSTFKYITDIYLLLWKTHNHSEIMDKLNTCNIYMAYLNKWTSILMLLQSSCQFLVYLFFILFLNHVKQFH